MIHESISNHDISVDTVSLDNQINIGRIHSLRIFDYAKECDPVPPALEGSFWELLYAEKGLVDINTPSSGYTLSHTGLLFRHPSETIGLPLQSPAPAKLICIGFSCTAPSGCPDAPGCIPSADGNGADSTSAAQHTALELLHGKILPIGSPERGLIRHIVTEAASCGPAAPFAAGQAAILYLQLLLIFLLRSVRSDITLIHASRSGQTAEEDILFHDIIEYMQNHIADSLTIDKICRDNLLGRAQLQKLFADYAGCGIIDYFLLMKINTAKQLIRDGKWNLSQISEQLGYSSLHYFSRQFKNITGTAPSEYMARARGGNKAL